jgi:hypothetical protein
VVARRVAALGALLLATLGACANGPGPASSVPTPVAAEATPGPPAVASVSPPAQARVDGVETSIEFEPAAERALEDAQIEILSEEPTLGQLPGWKDGRDTVHLPITDGGVVLAATPPRGRVRTDGALMLSRAGSELAFDDLVVDLDAARLAGTVDGRPITVGDLDLSRAHVEDLPSQPLTIVDLSARLSADALGEVRDRLGADLPPDTARVDLELRLRPA